MTTMPTYRWVLSGENLMMSTWNGDAQIVYLIEHDTTLTAEGQWWVRKKVSGAAEGYTIGCNSSLADAKRLAEADAEQPL